MNKEYKLNIDPRILELLGPSLYTNIYYVLAELIANAYDADAHNVYIIANKDDITVEDDGKGMNKEELEALIHGMDHDSGADRQSGFGVANVNQRIHIYYGEQYGISYESHPGEGTLVRIQVADHVSEVPVIQ